MNKYLRLGFHLSWISVLLVSLSFIFELISENYRSAVFQAYVNRPSWVAGFYGQQEEIQDRQVLLSSYIAQPLQAPHKYRRMRIINFGSHTSLIHINYLIEEIAPYYSEISIEDLERTKNKIQMLIDKVESPDFDDNINSIRNINNEITLLQKEVMDYENQTFNFIESKLDDYKKYSVLFSNFSTRLVLFAFFINLIIFLRLQWLEYKTERRIQGLLD